MSRENTRSETMKLNKYFEIALVLMLVNIMPIAVADDGKGLEIAREIKAREKGFINYSVELKMVLISITGKEKVRQLRVITREIDGDGDQSLAIFDSPADVKGTGFLSHTHIKQNDDQWLYLPSLKRVKRISPKNKVAPFMGSEFSYEDLASFEVEKFTYQYVGEEKLRSIDCFVLDRTPVNQFSGYSRQRIWVDKTRYIILKTDFYNSKDKKIKTLESRKFKKYLERFWFAHEMIMKNHLSGKSSVLYWQNFKFKQPLRDADFNPNSLKHIR